jgi:hypothetical protein
MLDRAAPPARQAQRQARRSSSAVRSRAYRQRQRAGRIVAPVPVDADVIELLLRLGWISEADASDRRAIGAAIATMLADTARRR